MERIITISLPSFKNEKSITSYQEEKSPYQLVENLPADWKSPVGSKSNHFGTFEIAELLPVHNASGIRDLKQISKMNRAVKKGLHILGSRGVPNIKMVVSPGNSLLIFDGHHSLVSYYESGKRYLRQVPYLVISASSYQPITVEEISYFFPERSRDKVVENWQAYTVNWEKPVGDQLEERKASSFAQLVSQLGERDKSAIKQQT